LGEKQNGGQDRGKGKNRGLWENAHERGSGNLSQLYLAQGRPVATIEKARHRAKLKVAERTMEKRNCPEGGKLGAIGRGETRQKSQKTKEALRKRDWKRERIRFARNNAEKSSDCCNPATGKNEGCPSQPGRWTMRGFTLKRGSS